MSPEVHRLLSTGTNNTSSVLKQTQKRREHTGTIKEAILGLTILVLNYPAVVKWGKMV